MHFFFTESNMLSALIVAGIVAFLVAMIRKITGKTYEDNAPSITEAEKPMPNSESISATSTNFSVSVSLFAAFVAFFIFAIILIALNAAGGSPIAALAAFLAYRGMRQGKIL